MTKHLADHSTDTTSGRLTQFLRIAHGQARNVWQNVWQTQSAANPGNRRLVEFVRIARKTRD
jgi:hypothetical protein